MQERNLKVRVGHRSYLLKSCPHAGNPTIPLILLQGTWLVKAGFIPELPIHVQVDHHRLIITPRK